MPHGSDWKKAASLTDEEIDAIEADDPDLEGIDDSWLEAAEITFPQSKSQLTLRLDKDVIAFFKHQGKGYQTRMNAVLRAYMQSQGSTHPQS
jgi:uncharacterized protein (DUF4415 family)